MENFERLEFPVARSLVDQAFEQFDCGREFSLLGRGELGLNGAGQPVLPSCAAGFDPLSAGGGERQEGLPPISRVRHAADESRRFQDGDIRAHGLRTHSERLREGRYRCRTRALQMSQHRDLRPRQVADMRLLAQFPPQPADQNSKVAGQGRSAYILGATLRFLHLRSIHYLKVNYEGKLLI